MTGVNQLWCFRCQWHFCGVCRSPCHPGRSCFSDPSQVVRMSKRRPPLLPHLQAKAQEAADEANRSMKQQDREFRVQVRQHCGDFDDFKQKFLATHGGSITRGLSEQFGAGVSLSATPLAAEVKSRFMQALQESAAEIRPAFHGTNSANYQSIFQRGLLIPGHGNELKIVHGAAHGTGIYTANVDAAWLSRGFCSEESMLVCAVVHTSQVRHKGDAMIVGRADLVAPMFLAAKGVEPDNLKHRYAAAAPSVAAPSTSDAKGAQTQTKGSKFKARLAARSKRH